MNVAAYCLGELFIMGGQTRQNYPFLTVGCCRGETDNRLLNDVAGCCRAVSVPGRCDPRLLDEIIARPLQRFGGKLIIAGCTINASRITRISGGVLGDPARPRRSACRGGQERAGDWRIVAFPGGPGIAYEKAGEDIGRFAALDRQLNGRELLIAIAGEACQHDVSKLIAVTDGSGDGAQGGAIVQNGRDYIVWSLAELI